MAATRSVAAISFGFDDPSFAWLRTYESKVVAANDGAGRELVNLCGVVTDVEGPHDKCVQGVFSQDHYTDTTSNGRLFRKTTRIGKSGEPIFEEL